MKFGIYFPQGGYGEYRHVEKKEISKRIELLASIIDDSSFQNLWLYDHMFSYFNPELPSFEAWMLLSYLAANTRRIRLGTLVSSEPFRNPGLLAKMVSTLDVLSNGRMNLGVGAGWDKREMEAYGFEFLEPKVRIQRFIEMVETLWLLLDSKVVEANFDGKYHKLKHAINSPKPVQEHIPLWIGADKPRMLRVAAKYADVVNLNTDPEGLRERSETLKQFETEEGREVERSLFTRVVISKTNERAHGIFDTLIEGELKQAVLKRDKSSMLKKWIVGDAETCVQRISEFRDAGAQSMELGFVFEDLPDPEVIALFVDKVLPNY
ncbi:MAG: LLM class flavin-dependent oxidoreductase [Nitrososphaerota archaeon]|nr:LLM class flavin-dependent oxidoreductase [Nitrososphaerota archaeon]